MSEKEAHTTGGGFTLIELSIVLVVIGLIAGGLLVGQNLLRAAAVRATISQIEKFTTAANTFRDKYGYLPGDIKNPEAGNFGFAPRGSLAGQGDGNGVLQGTQGHVSACPNSAAGELVMFWVDLSTAHLIDGNFSMANSFSFSGPVTGSGIDAYLPAAKLGGSNYISVFSGFNMSGSYTGINYLGLTSVSMLAASNAVVTNVGLTVQQAYEIDQKIDDGLPQLGNVTAQFMGSTGYPAWSAGGGCCGNSGTGATAGSTMSCYDNSVAASGTPGINGATQHYSVEISGGSNVNCALGFRLP